MHIYTYTIVHILLYMLILYTLLYTRIHMYYPLTLPRCRALVTRSRVPQSGTQPIRLTEALMFLGRRNRTREQWMGPACFVPGDERRSHKGSGKSQQKKESGVEDQV